MEKFKYLLERLKNLHVIQKHGDWAENLPDDIWNDFFKDNFEEIKYHINTEKHRWYEVSTTVIKIYGKLLGITYINDLFSESMSLEDCNHEITFSEMKEIKTPSFIPID